MDRSDAQPALSVMLIVSDADAAVRWYETALGAGQLWDLGGVAGLELGGAPFFIHEAVPGKGQELSPGEAGFTTTRIEVFVAAPDELIARAVQAGATDVEEATDYDTPWVPIVREVIPIPLVIVGRWAIGPRWNRSRGSAASPASRLVKERASDFDGRGRRSARGPRVKRARSGFL